jgi:hypothetical protein
MCDKCFSSERLACPPSKPAQAAKQPHGDLSAAEVEGSVRSVEHLLWLSQRGRAVLASLDATYRQLSALHDALSALRGPSGQPGGEQAAELPPQRACQAWYRQQRRVLAALQQQAEETRELLEAAAAAETAAPPRKQLQRGAQDAAAAASVLQGCLGALASASGGAVALPASSAGGGAADAGGDVFLPAAVLAALRANASALDELQQRLEAAEREHGAPLPGWALLAAAVAEAAHESRVAARRLQAGSADAAAALPEEQQQQLAQQLEAAVAAALVWAQSAQPAGAGAAPPAAQDASAAEADGEAEQVPLPELLQQLEQRLCLPKAADLAAHTAALLSTLAAASNAPPGAAARRQLEQLGAAAGGLAPLLGLLLCALRQLGLQYLSVHKAAAKLCHISASLFAGLVQEGFCMPEGGEGEAEGGEGRAAEGTGLGDGDTSGAKDISNEVRPAAWRSPGGETAAAAFGSAGRRAARCTPTLTLCARLYRLPHAAAGGPGPASGRQAEGGGGKGGAGGAAGAPGPSETGAGCAAATAPPRPAPAPLGALRSQAASSPIPPGLAAGRCCCCRRACRVKHPPRCEFRLLSLPPCRPPQAWRWTTTLAAPWKICSRMSSSRVGAAP